MSPCRPCFSRIMTAIFHAKWLAIEELVLNLIQHDPKRQQDVTIDKTQNNSNSAYLCIHNIVLYFLRLAKKRNHELSILFRGMVTPFPIAVVGTRLPFSPFLPLAASALAHRDHCGTPPTHGGSISPSTTASYSIQFMPSNTEGREKSLGRRPTFTPNVPPTPKNI